MVGKKKRGKNRRNVGKIIHRVWIYTLIGVIEYSRCLRTETTRINIRETTETVGEQTFQCSFVKKLMENKNARAPTRRNCPGEISALYT